ncbi:lysophospholipid acyltransferase family protein [Labrys portucalensis]|uniref:Lysophospholipid acyltransferase family protein n=1 Tax=Labrys neptuniae TaxID=376174 RepID=A0ABV6ZCR7_9HYPH|nr:lysophospholipid acyltransferase family protein [Labrys neptuniae]MDT3376294.1 lysophospholipid acyltransferase family protein [Labrys neptuniae]
MFGRLVGSATIGFARLVTGVRGNWQGCLPARKPRIYFANHASHGDFILVWTVFPSALRATARPVAARDYWNAGATRRFLAHNVFDAVLIDRESTTRSVDPIGQMASALEAGSSLILFPEGTRNMGEEPLLPFKSGLFWLAKRQPDVEMVPVWIENLNRVMPKGEFLPVPFLCTVTFGAPLRLGPGEEKQAFLDRSRNALLALRPHEGDEG